MLFQFYSCKRKNDAEFILSEYQRSDTFQKFKSSFPDSIKYRKGYTAYLQYDNSDHLKKIYGRMLNSKYGHYFEINNLEKEVNGLDYGRLTNYKFLTLDSNFYYAIQFNFTTRKYSEIYSPYVDYSLQEFSQKDTLLKYTFYFSGFPRKNIKALYSFDKRNYVNLDVHENDFMPFLKTAHLTINKNVPIIYIKTFAEDLLVSLPGIQNERAFFDKVGLYSLRIN